MQSYIFALLLSLVTTVRDLHEEAHPPAGSKGILDKPIREALEALRPALADFHITHFDFESGPQEFGTLKGYFGNIEIKGLETFNITILNTSWLDIKNLTIVIDKINLKGLYNVTGLLAFPLGKNDIYFFGDGELSGEFKNISISVGVKIRLVDGQKVVKSLDIFADLKGLNVYLKNLMGDYELEAVFNGLINDLGLTLINYYKTPVLNQLKSELIKIINEMLEPKEESVNKEEL